MDKINFGVGNLFTVEVDGKPFIAGVEYERMRKCVRNLKKLYEYSGEINWYHRQWWSQGHHVQWHVA